MDIIFEINLEAVSAIVTPGQMSSPDDQVVVVATTRDRLAGRLSWKKPPGTEGLKLETCREIVLPQGLWTVLMPDYLSVWVADVTTGEILRYLQNNPSSPVSIMIPRKVLHELPSKSIPPPQ